MGPRRILQAAGVVAACLTGLGVADAKPHERVAIIDLGPADSTIRQKLSARVVAGGFEPVIGDGVDDALAGERGDTDQVQLAAAMAEAQRAFGALDCKATVTAANQAVGIAAARQAAGIPVPELPRAAAYLLLCADRAGDTDAAMVAATRVRAAGGSPDVPADLWKKYPELDAIGDRELVSLEITSDAPGAEIWIDFRHAGKAPLTIDLPSGDHVIAAASGTRRGWAAGTAIKSQKQLAIPTPDRAGKWAEVARRIATWHGKIPEATELGWVMAKISARVVLIRRGDTVEGWGRAGLVEAPHKLGGDDAVAPIAEVDRILALATDRVASWNEHAPDPDRPLLLDDGRSHGNKLRDPPTRWWVYASLAGAIVGGVAIIYATDRGTDRQRVEVHVP